MGGEGATHICAGAGAACSSRRMRGSTRGPMAAGGSATGPGGGPFMSAPLVNG